MDIAQYFLLKYEPLGMFSYFSKLVFKVYFFKIVGFVA